MYNRFGQVRHVGQNKCPLRSAQAQGRTHAQSRIWRKNVLKRRGKGKIIIANHLYEVVEGFLAKQESVRFAGERFKDLKWNRSKKSQSRELVMTLSLKEPCLFPFLLTIRSEENIHCWNIWFKIKNDYMSLRLFKLACWNCLRAGKKVVQ